MIRRFKYFLYEGRIDFIKRTTPEINSSHDTLAQHREAGDIIDHFANNADPTKNKQYTQWIVNRYHKGQFRQEDHPRIKEALSDFETHKAKLEHKDINRYPSLNHLENALKPHLDATPEVSDRQREKQLKENGADKIYDNNGLTVHKINNMNGAIIYGRGTKWCTAATSATASFDDEQQMKGHITEVHYENDNKPSHYTITDKNGQSSRYKAHDVEHSNMFHEYHKPNDPLYVVQTPDKQKYQFHIGSQQFMNEQDEPIDHKEFAKKYPEIGNEIPKFRNSVIGLHSAQNQKDFDSRIHALNERDHNNYEDVVDGVKMPALPELPEIENSKFFNDSHVQLYKDHPSNEHNYDAYRHLTDKGRLTDADKEEMKKSKFTLTQKLLIDHDDNYRKEVLKDPNNTNIGEAIKASPELTADQLHDYVDKLKGKYQIINSILSHPNMSDETLQKIWKEYSKPEYLPYKPIVQRGALLHPNASKEFIERNFEDTNDYTHKDILSSHPPEKLKGIVDKYLTKGGSSATLHHILAHYPYLSEQQLHSHLNSFKNPNISSLIKRNTIYPLPDSVKQRIGIK